MRKRKVYALVLQCSLQGIVERVVYSDLNMDLPVNMPFETLVHKEGQNAAARFLSTVRTLDGACSVILKIQSENYLFTGLRSENSLVLTGVTNTEKKAVIKAKQGGVNAEVKETSESVSFGVEADAMFFESAPVAVIVFNSAGIIHKWNKKATETLGYHTSEVLGKALQEFLVTEEDKQTLTKFLKEYSTSEPEEHVISKRVDVAFSHKSGETVGLECRITSFRTNAELVFSAYVIDNSAQKETIQILQEKDRQILEISSSIPGVVFQFLRSADGAYSFNFYSDKIEQLTGVAAADVYQDVNIAWKSVHPDDLPQLMGSIEKSAADLSSWAHLYRIVTPEGRTRYIQGVSQPTANANGSIVWNGAFLDVTETVLAEHRAKLSETHYRMLLESLKEGVLHLDKDCRIVYANPQMSLLTGFSLDEMVGQDPAVLFRVFEDDPETRARHLISRADEKNCITEIVIFKKTGERTWLSRKTTTILDEEGNLVSIIASHQDITDRIRAEEKIKQSEKLYRALFQSSPLPMWVYSCETLRFLAVNKAAVNHYQYSEDEFLAKTILDIQHAEDRIRSNHTLSGNKTHLVNTTTSRHYKKNGELIDVLVTGCTFDYNGKSSVLVVVQDISERLKAEEDKSRLISIIEATTDIIAVFDTEGRSIFINSAGCRFLKLRPDGIESEESVFRKLTIQDLLSPALVEEIGVFGSWSGELTMRDGSGLDVPVSVVVMAHKNWRGELQYYSVNARDISDLKAALQALQTSEARYKSLFEQSPIPKFSLDANGTLISANQAYKKILPVYSSTNLPLSFLSVFDKELRPQTQMRLQQVLQGSAQTYNTVLADKDQNRLIVNITLMPIVVNGHIEGAYGMMQDETNLFYTTQELQESQRELRELTARIQVAQEEERKYIAREIHDELGQILTALNIDVTLLTKKVVAMVGDENARELNSDLEELKKISKEAIFSVKRIVSELRPLAIDELGLPSELSLYLERFRNRYGIATKLIVPEEPLPFTAKQAIEVFRIIQEALTNVARHSNASNVTVEIAHLPNLITIMVKDDGVGIQKSGPSNGKSFGLIGMRERTLSIGGKYKLDSAPGKGTTVYLELPISPLVFREESLAQHQQQ